jgi:methyl-galactoside transport system substrate-binding protein
MKFRKFFSLSLIFSLVISNFVFAATDFSYKNKVNVYINDLTDSFNREFAEQITTLAHNMNIEIELFNGSKNDSLAINQIQHTLDLDEGVIILTRSQSVTDFAAEYVPRFGAQLVFYKGHPGANILDAYKDSWFVGYDVQESVKYQSEMIIDYLNLMKTSQSRKQPHRDNINFVMLIGGKEKNKEAMIRTEYLWKFVTRSGFILNPLSANNDNWKKEEAYKDMQNILKKYKPEDIDLIISNNDSMALGAIEALNEIGYNLGTTVANDNNIPVFSIDGIAAGIKAVMEKKLAGTVYTDRVSAARAALILATSPQISVEDAEKNIGLKVKSNREIIIPYLKVASFREYQRE